VKPLAQPRHAAPQDGERGAQPFFARRPALTAAASMITSLKGAASSAAAIYPRGRARAAATARLRRLRRSPQHATIARQLDAADPRGHGLALQPASAAAVATAALAAAHELLRCDRGVT
jgi:hypothetical protein